MKKPYLFAVVILLFFTEAFSQKQADIWYFGHKAGIDFNSGSPVAITNSAMFTEEGCSSISDKNGNLLFYTNGVNVWNSSHTQMTNGNGLNGDTASAQSCIIVPKPGSSTLYYIFTVAAEGGAAGVCYSEVDMTLNGGLGDVVTASKNSPLLTPSAEKICAVKHANGLYVWVITHELTTDAFVAYLVDCNGVNSAVQSNTGQSETLPGWGYMETSPDGHKLAKASRSVGFEVFDFDNATGAVSNPVFLGNPNECYGVSFSPDNNVLYGLKINDGSIWQWNLQAGSSAAIIASAIQIGTAAGTGSPYLGGALQLGPDGKLYVTQYYQPYLSVISSPNTIGAGCGFQTNAVDLLGDTAVLGLPLFFQGFLDTTSLIDYSGNCSGHPVTFSISSNTASLDSVYWDFGEPSSGMQDTSTSFAPSHTYASGSVFNVMLIRYLNCISDTAYQPVNITGPATSSQNVTLCAGGTYILPAGGFASSAGSYIDTIPASNGCDSVVTTVIAISVMPPVDTYDTICQGQSYQRPSGVYASAAGTYTDTVHTAAGCDSIINTHLAVNPTSSTTLYDTICKGSTFTLPNGVGISIPGDYLLTLTNRFGCDSVVTIKLAVIDLQINVQGNNALCLGQNTGSITSTTSQGIPPYTYYLADNTGAIIDSNATGSFDSIATGSYTVSVTEGHGCSVSTNVNVDQSDPTLLVLKVANLSCYHSHDGEISIKATGGVPAYTYNLNQQMQNTTGDFRSLDAGNYNYFVTDARGCVAFGDTVIKEPEELLVTVWPDSAVAKLGDTVQLGASSNYDTSATYLWSPPVGLSCDTCHDPVITIENSLVYDLLVNTGTGCSVTVHVPVTIIPDYTLFVPNVFTPDGNGQNDFFQIYGSLYLLKYIDVRVFNRIGEKVFESNDINFKWDGTFRGQKVPAAVLTYTIDAVFIDNHAEKLLTGSLTLLR